MDKLKISKELLERYELGQCTKEEEATVRLWLDADDLMLEESLAIEEDIDTTVDPAIASVEADKDLAIKQQLWQNISSHTLHATPFTQANDAPPPRSTSPRALRKQPFQAAQKWLSIAAAVALFLCISCWTLFSRNSQAGNFKASNSEQPLMLWEEDGFALTLSQNSSASINLQSENIAVSGDILFTPKRDFVLHDKNGKTDFDFREGQVYYISTHPNTSKLMVFSQKELQYLPPILRKHIRKQFNLT
ncbi:hypothetical protein [Sphingobacterium deserti]|uniref:Uncharacterized protein n=1 Tax=Sphingobacterium deserti TaxID=1229276 RepID=A0A0B8SZH5_9SPHI|nr:hypothetical protein [Sphingobacterium deserti]KGE12941.1 hypothetical protein DI53_3378 [Sphingobacterium deserti]